MGAPEVRQCSSCTRPAAICVRDWQHTNLFGETGMSTRDFACQSCGHTFTLVPKMYVWIPAIFAVIFSWTVCFGLVFGGWALFRAWPWMRNPVVPGAPYPELRAASGASPHGLARPIGAAVEPLRRCTRCGGAAACRRVTRHSTNGIPTGTEYGYQCTACPAAFTMESPLRVGLDFLGAAFCTVLGILTILGGVGIVFFLGALVLAGMGTWSTVAYLRHPVVRQIA